MELLQGILENSQYAFLTAAILGLMTAVSPCPLAYAVGNVGKMYNRIRTFELWFRRVVAVLFIGVGIWYIFSAWL